jgi:hypothetical protein
MVIYQPDIFHIFLKINMKYKYESGRSRNLYLFKGTSFAILFEKSEKYKTNYVEFCFENYLE